MKIISTTALQPEQKADILQLWNAEYPVQLAYSGQQELENYLQKLADLHHFLLVDEEERVRGWLATFERDQDRWFVMIVGYQHQGKGFGTQLLQQAKEREDVLNGWVTDHERDVKKDGTPYPSPILFYQKNGFTVLPHIRLENEKLSTVKICWKR
ncbi:GNAT family N-acetyltransferase [Flavilitoribacter nigricans]|uniref:N-acetyltransferase domain-containing protein n=1 Tax=Flavilitoribacter nigricans (strain ATCC 23147 / DSM 23189 / NBRC 102662 / NCIMB 1420 / SS-2) TaxID=1122177 RepID=A0A2D0NGV6_FLAN2|nr:GNAT family N-acetyltransferase [Flavilitoribacter nigricans]PHN07648.1 hypothetical protein CRP01_05990 [Flavilitoribacter nigricans DSM 23189 = NBRC 102662]